MPLFNSHQEYLESIHENCISKDDVSKMLDEFEISLNDDMTKEDLIKAINDFIDNMEYEINR